jgi:hypothetical protein
VSELEFVAFSDDGKMIILQTGEGNWVEVPITEPKASYAAPDELASDVELSPREIQSRIRAGVNPAELAATTGNSLERIMSFAPPILLERSHVASKATKTVVRRSNGSGTLGEIVRAKLESAGVQDEAISWDSYRRDDGRWSVTVSFPSDHGPRMAAWLFDVRNNALVAADEDARWLTGDQNRSSDESVSQNTKPTETVEFLAPVTSINEMRETSKSESIFDEVETVERPTTEISQIPVDVAEDSPTENTVDTQVSTEFLDPVIAELTSTTPQTLGESDSADFDGAESQSESPKKDDSESNSDVRPPKIPSWDEILFGPTSEND